MQYSALWQVAQRSLRVAACGPWSNSRQVITWSLGRITWWHSSQVSRLEPDIIVWQVAQRAESRSASTE
jgi:hypothetical protein